MSELGSVIEALWEYLKGCPLLSEYTIGVNFRTDDLDSAGIVEDHTDTVKLYLSGAELKVMHASLFLGALSYADIQRIQTSAYLEELRKWFKAASNERELPKLPEGYSAEDIGMDGAIPFEYDKDGKKCTYQMNISLEFIERND